jgi:putative membrane protein
MHDGGWGVWWMIFSWVLIVAIVALVVRALTASGGSSGSGERTIGAREILDERFARGEISEDEYRERKRVLDESRR